MVVTSHLHLPSTNTLLLSAQIPTCLNFIPSLLNFASFFPTDTFLHFLPEVSKPTQRERQVRRELIEGRAPEVEELNRIVQAWPAWSNEMIFCVVQCNFCGGAAVSESEGP